MTDPGLSQCAHHAPSGTKAGGAVCNGTEYFIGAGLRLLMLHFCEQGWRGREHACQVLPAFSPQTDPILIPVQRWDYVSGMCGNS